MPAAVAVADASTSSPARYRLPAERRGILLNAYRHLQLPTPRLRRVSIRLKFSLSRAGRLPPVIIITSVLIF